MVLEDTLVKLVEHVRCYTIIDVAVRKILPEWFKGPKVLGLEFGGFQPSGLIAEDMKGL